MTQMVKPFLYHVPVSNFGQVEEVCGDADEMSREAERPTGRSTSAFRTSTEPPGPTRLLAVAPAARESEQGKRDMAWRPDGQGVTFLEQEPAPANGSGQGRRGGQAVLRRLPETRAANAY